VLCGYARTGLWSASAKFTLFATRLRQKEGREKPLPLVAAAPAARGWGSMTRPHLVGSPFLPTSVFTLWLLPGSCVAPKFTGYHCAGAHLRRRPGEPEGQLRHRVCVRIGSANKRTV